MSHIEEELGKLARAALESAAENRYGGACLESPAGTVFATASDAEALPSEALDVLFREDMEGSVLLVPSDSGWQAATSFGTELGPFILRVWLGRGEGSNSDQTALSNALAQLTSQCKALLDGYLEPQAEGASLDDVLTHCASLSPDIDCLAVVGRDDVLAAAGASSSDVPSRLSRYLDRVDATLGFLEYVYVRQIVVQSDDRSVTVGRFGDADRFLAVACRGPRSRALAQLAFKLSRRRVAELGIENPHTTKRDRMRQSWLEAPSLVPHGAYVSKKGSPIFHEPGCRLLRRSNSDLLAWFPARRDAIAAGQRPCRICRV